jgi:hypothetical protein
MKIQRLFVTALLVLSITGCGSKVTSPKPAATTTSAKRSYNGTASVGDFINIAIDGTSHFLSYYNRSNGDSATVPYTVNGDGSYTIADPSGNMVAAYEVPNFVLLVQATKTGPGHDVASLVTAVQTAPISVSSIANQHYNYMQFRTASGGVEVGSALVSGAGLVQNSSYWPYGAMSGGSAFNNGQVSANSFIADSSGTFLRLPDGVGEYDYLFGTPNGVFAVDTPNGAILGFAQATAKEFAPANAGTYHAIFYSKTGAHTGMGNVETGTAGNAQGTVTVTAGGGITITDAGSTVLASGTLVPLADSAYLYGTPGQLADPCNGMFTVRTGTVSTQQDVFVTFLGQAVLFSSFKTALPMNGGNAYDYFYGAALK